MSANIRKMENSFDRTVDAAVLEARKYQLDVQKRIEIARVRQAADRRPLADGHRDARP